jgi:hypothetical protein
MTDGTRVSGARIKIGNGTSVYEAYANLLQPSSTAVIRNGTGIPILPLVIDPCELPELTCGGDDVVVPSNFTLTFLPPGTYGSLRVANGASVRLASSGTYNFCDVKLGRNAMVEATGQVVINVVGSMRVGADSEILTPFANAPIILNVGGKKVRISQSAVMKVILNAPNAKLKIQRGGTIFGCFCSDKATTDKHTSLLCLGSASGAFVD